MNQTQYAPAATAGGQQNGPVSLTASEGSILMKLASIIDTAIDNSFTLYTANVIGTAGLPELWHLDNTIVATR